MLATEIRYSAFLNCQAFAGIAHKEKVTLLQPGCETASGCNSSLATIKTDIGVTCEGRGECSAPGGETNGFVSPQSACPKVCSAKTQHPAWGEPVTPRAPHVSAVPSCCEGRGSRRTEVTGSSGGRGSAPAPRACAPPASQGPPALPSGCAGCDPLQCGLQPARVPSTTPSIPACALPVCWEP